MLKLQTTVRAGAFMLTLGATLLSSCGGGSGGIASAPPPAVGVPAPTPTPAPSALIAAPARATSPTGSAAVLAAEGGPNFNTGPTAGTEFPLLQTVVLIADYDEIAASPTLSGSATADSSQLMITNAPHAVIELSGHPDLDWTRLGSWFDDSAWWDGGGIPIGTFVLGYQTPEAAIPTSGTATYSGLAEGSVFYPQSPTSADIRGWRNVDLTGTASFTADFATQRVAGTLTGLIANAVRWNDVAFDSLIAGNGFTGNTRVTTAPDGIASLAGNATGTIEGRFFGPSAQEVGAVWTLHDGVRAAMGTLSGRTCGCGGAD